MRKLVLYIYYFFTADTKEVRLRAAQLADKWCKPRNPRWTDLYWIERDKFLQSYLVHYCHAVATVNVRKKLGL